MVLCNPPEIDQSNVQAKYEAQSGVWIAEEHQD